VKRPPELPRVGTKIHDPLFGGGATIRVTRTLPPHKGAHQKRGWRVSVQIELDDGRKIEQRGRCWSLQTWLDSASRHKAADQGERGEG